jgi:ABC-2 type transport system ATP-binding protein
MEILKADSLFKKFGNTFAVNNVSLSVDEGRIFGMLGPNGAGKTTTIRMITNIIYPDSGEIMIMGEKLTPKLQDKIGYLPEERGLYKKIKVIEQLEYFGQLKGLSKKEANHNAKKWLEKIGASGWDNKKIEELSKGMAQKIQFVSTVLHNPPFMIFDEPFSGFDPINTELIKNIMLEMKSEGKTIILSTHQMYQVEQICDEILMIDQGKVVLSGALRDVKKNYGKNHLVIEYYGNSDFLQQISKEKILDYSNNRVELKIDNYEEAQEILKMAMTDNQITKFSVEEPSLNEIFIEIVSKMRGISNESK